MILISYFKVNKNINKNNNVINSSLIFKKWIESFSILSYKKNKVFENLVKIDNEINIEVMKNLLKQIIGETTIEIYKDDTKNFSIMIENVINENELSNYFNN